MNALRRLRRGQATVELAVLMIVLLPLIFYTLFLEDLLQYNLDWQEAVVTPPWDYAFVDYTATSADTAATQQTDDGDAPAAPAVSTNYDGLVQHTNRLTFCDHSSAYDSFNRDYDCDDKTHHQALAAHQCWLVRGAKQVTCGTDGNVGRLISPEFDKNNGGLSSCSAKLGVQNYFIIHKWALGNGNNAYDEKGGGQVAHNFAKDNGGNVHSNARGGSSSNAWVFGERTSDSFGVLFDPWALNQLASLSPDAPKPGHKLYDRVNTYYVLKGAIAAGKASDFLSKIGQEHLINSAKAGVDGMFGDTPITPGVAYDPEHTRTFSDHYASAWSDDCQRQTYGNRTDKYFGQPEPQ